METLHKDSQKHIGQFVAEDFRTAAVFSKYGIDFCCRGDRTIEEVCEKRSINSGELLEELKEVQASDTQQSIDFRSWPLDLLAEYVEKKHHRYIEEKTPVILQFLDKLCKVHGSRHPELLEITEIFTASSKELAAHMKKEELILFPFIKKMVKTQMEGAQLQPPRFGTVENPIAMMKEEHVHEGERFEQISRLSDAYTPPSDACNTYRATFAMLDAFEKDLHLHIHLENNILFPKAIKLEQMFD